MIKQELAEITMTQIDDMPAGQELDALVAEKVMGWRRVSEWGLQTMGKPSLDGTSYTSEMVPNYSTDIAAAWEVVEKMEQQGFEWVISFDELWFQRAEPDEPGFACGVAAYDKDATKIPFHICRAALKAVESGKR